MKKILSRAALGLCIVSVLSLAACIVLELLRLLDIAGICFVVFLISALILILGMAIVALISIKRQIEEKGIRQAIAPLALQALIGAFIIFLLGYLFWHQWNIWESLAGGVLLSLISVLKPHRRL